MMLADVEEVILSRPQHVATFSASYAHSKAAGRERGKNGGLSMYLYVFMEKYKCNYSFASYAESLMDDGTELDVLGAEEDDDEEGENNNTDDDEDDDEVESEEVYRRYSLVVAKHVLHPNTVKTGHQRMWTHSVGCELQYNRRR